MKKHALIFSFFAFSIVRAQEIYFPPTDSDLWDTTGIAELGWCEDKTPELFAYLDEKNTKAFLVLKDGKIVIEKYFDTFTKDSLWYWASAGKTITAVLTGIAQQEGLLDIADPTSDYLGLGWTSCTPEQEAAITVWNQLTMTTGLYDNPADVYCTDPACLTFEADAGAEWAYHNAPYTLLDGVLSEATGTTLNMYCNMKLEAATGMSGIFIPIDYNNVYFSKARDMARFGLMMLNEGYWDTEGVLTDADYYSEMINTSQDLNKAYGYLWWLNGKESFMAPSSEMVFDGSLLSNAPNDLYSALGKDGQILNVVPSQNLLVVRMGQNPGGLEAAVPTALNNTIWEYLNEVICGTASLENETETDAMRLHPNPAQTFFQVDNRDYTHYAIVNALGQTAQQASLQIGLNQIPTDQLREGIYYVIFSNSKGKSYTQKLVVQK